MAANENIYGLKADWIPATGTTFTEDTNNNYYLANFGSNSSYNVSTLKAGIDNGKLSLNTAIDKTLCWCGLGNFSTFSRCEYYNRKQGDDFKKFNADNRNVTNFALFQHASNWTLASSHCSTWYYADTSNTTYGSRARWQPNAQDGDSSTTGNFNMGLMPVVQVPIKNCVVVPLVRVKSDITTTTSSTYYTLYMWDYLNPDNTVNYTTHPYIINVGLQLWGNINEVSTGNRSNRLSDTFIAVTDDITAAEGQPVNISIPSILQGKSTHYYAFDKTHGISQQYPYIWITIAGLLSNNSDTISIPTSNNVIRQAGGNIVLPLEGGQFTEPVSNNRIYYTEYYAGFAEWVRRQIACFGLFFTDDKATAESGALDADTMYLGILDDNNIGQGFYSSGSQNRQQKQWEWTSTNDSDYNPSAEIDDNVYGRDWGFNPVSIADSTVRRYVMSDNELSNFGKYLWDIIDTQNPDELIQNQTLTNFLTNNPLDCVVSLKRFPFADMSQASPVNIVLGKVAVPSVTGRPFTSDAVVRSCGHKKIYHLFKDWRDYICDYFLYLPFCGTLKLDAETVVGRDLYVYYAIDYTTGTCTAYVTTRDDDGAEFYLDAASGNCAIDIPLSGVETATLTGEIYNANENLKALKFNGIVGAAQGALNIAGAAGSGNKLAAAGAGLQAGAGIVNAIHDVTTADWNVHHTQIPLKMVGASSGCNSLQGELTPCIIRYYPITDTAYNEENYLHTVGAACCESETIGNYSGYAEIVNTDLSGLAATADEINMIKTLLAKGVYL